jgi:preprotein translocase subunit SecE
MANINADKPKKKSRIGSFLSKSGSELKKVSWPTFATVVRNTVTVLVVVLAFTVLVSAVDLGLTQLLKLLVGTGS